MHYYQQKEMKGKVNKPLNNPFVIFTAHKNQFHVP